MKRFLPCLSLLLAALILWGGLSLGCRSLRCTHSGSVSLWLPPEDELRRSPGVVLCYRDRALATELCRRGYAVAMSGKGHAGEAYAELVQCEQVDIRDIALIARGQSVCQELLALDRELTATENYPWALVLWNCSAENTEGLANVLTLKGSAESEVEGYFGEGSARKTSAYTTHFAAARATIDWIGSTLGHPRDGALEDSELLYPYARCCYALAALLAAYGGFMCIKKKKSR